MKPDFDGDHDYYEDDTPEYYSCKVCANRFTNPSSMILHIIVAHRETLNSYMIGNTKTGVFGEKNEK